MKHTEASIQRILGKTYGIERGYVTMPNVLLMVGGMYEADFIYITKSNYLFEVEIKISISDFKADFDKNVITITLKLERYITLSQRSYGTNTTKTFWS